MTNSHPLQAILGGGGLTLADVGASYFLPDTWQLLTGLPSTTFVLFDPNGSNLQYTRAYPNTRFVTLPCALSGAGGVRTLYLSNTDSGSSLYPPLDRHWERESDNSYFFPLKLVDIETFSLEQALDRANVETVDAIKLDTQGSELEILLGLDEARWPRLLFVELEVSLQNPPLYRGAARVNEVQHAMERKGFNLVNVRTSRGESSTTSGISVPNECDLLFARDASQIAELADRERLARRSIALACTYYLHDFAKQFLNQEWGRVFFPAERERKLIGGAIDAISSFQDELLARGRLSLWHRDS
ncbi:MAG: FkbM family methyltransferase [Geitlerinemataceae cyanobacterium]